MNVIQNDMLGLPNFATGDPSASGAIFTERYRSIRVKSCLIDFKKDAMLKIGAELKFDLLKKS